MDSTVDSGIVQTPPATEQPLRWRSYLGSIGMVVLVTLVGLLVHFFLNPTNVIMLYLLGIVLIARRWGQGPSTVGALLSVLAFDVFFVPPT